MLSSAWFPLHPVWPPLLMLCSLCPSSHDHFWFLSQGGKLSLGKKVLPWPSSFISVFYSQESYWSGAGSLGHCFQTPEAEAAWKSNDETKIVIVVSYEAFLQPQPGRGQWVAKTWLRGRTGLKTENFARLKLSQASVECRWFIYSKCHSTDLCFLQHKTNGAVSELPGGSLPENGPSWLFPVGPPLSFPMLQLCACFSAASTETSVLKFIRGTNYWYWKWCSSLPGAFMQAGVMEFLFSFWNNGVSWQWRVFFAECIIRQPTCCAGRYTRALVHSSGHNKKSVTKHVILTHESIH